MTHTVLDSASIDTLYRMAGDEGLLRDLPDGDGLLASLGNQPRQDWHQQQVLEQVIINTTLHTLAPRPIERVDGELWSMGLLHQPFESIEPSEEGRSISPDIIEGLLRARGYDKPVDQWFSEFERANSIRKEVEAFELEHPGVKIDSFSAILRAAIDRSFRNTPEHVLAMRWNEASGAVSPLLSAVTEFLRLSKYAQDRSIGLKTPVHKLSANLFNFASTSEIEPDSVNIYRIVTDKLGVLPIRNSLRECIALSKHPDAVSLREQMVLWQESFGNDHADLTMGIQREIQRASSSLKKAENIAHFGYVSAVLSIPTSISATLVPFLGGVGLSLKLIGVLAETGSLKMKEKIRWIGFGTIHG